MKTCFKCDKKLQDRNVSGACQDHFDSSEYARILKKKWRDRNADKVRLSGKKSRDSRKEAIRAYHREYAIKHKDKIVARIKEKRLNWDSTFKKFGITAKEYHELVAKQNGVCAICQSDSCGRKGSTRLCIDHDHKTGKVRGLLCNACNVSLGAMGDDPERLLKAYSYLLKNKSESDGDNTRAHDSQPPPVEAFDVL